ncbi:vWA domain-containing protein [Flavobacterium sp. GCM10023249]|uniref:vWA domain-containing protein n=1 Tax=unclassified Flavobacterium TaxID=196869 RepID=UPI0036117B5A
MIKITFLNPEFFWLFLLLPLAVVWYFVKRNEEKPTLKVSSLKGFKSSASVLPKLQPILFVLRILALSALIVALARPRTIDLSNKNNDANGIDIVIATDVSSSMLARDLEPNRLEALKNVASKFIIERVNDRIGVVVYAAEAYTKVPVTIDKAVVLNAVNTIQYDRVIQDGTAIGMGLATAVNRLKDSKAKSKVIILMTDGVNNSGFLEPVMASEIAADLGIKVYTIGIGTNGNALFPYFFPPNGQPLFRMQPVEIDEKLLKEIAEKTGGRYFRAIDKAALEGIYKEINKLETTKIEELKYVNYDEKFRIFAGLAGLLLLIEMVLRNTIFRSFI